MIQLYYRRRSLTIRQIMNDINKNHDTLQWEKCFEVIQVTKFINQVYLYKLQYSVNSDCLVCKLKEFILRKI